MKMTPNHALQRTRRQHRGCNSRVPSAGSLSSYESCQVTGGVRPLVPFSAAR